MWEDLNKLAPLPTICTSTVSQIPELQSADPLPVQRFVYQTWPLTFMSTDSCSPHKQTVHCPFVRRTAIGWHGVFTIIATTMNSLYPRAAKSGLLRVATCQRTLTTLPSGAVSGRVASVHVSLKRIVFFENCVFIWMRRIVKSDRKLPIWRTEMYRIEFQGYLLFLRNAAKF